MGESKRRRSAFIAMRESGFAIKTVGVDQAIDGAPGAAEQKSGSVFIAVGVKEILDNFILFLFIHSEINLSDDDHLQRR